MNTTMKVFGASLWLASLVYSHQANAAGGSGGNTTTGNVAFEAALPPATSGFYAGSTAVSGDTALVASWKVPNAEVHVFQRTGTTWVRQAKLVPTTPSSTYGIHVAISGNTAVVGDNDLVTTASGQKRGATYIFRRTGTIWRQEAKILGPSYSPGTIGTGLPTSVSASGDSVAIGLGDEADLNTGAVDVYVRKVSLTGVTSWVRQVRLPGSVGGYGFGMSVAIDGDTLAAGEQNATIGAVLVFRRTNGIWVKQAKLVPITPLSPEMTMFGSKVALSGNTVLVDVRSFYETKPKQRVYVFQRTGTTWAEQALLTDPNSLGTNGFGDSLGISGDLAVVADQTLSFGSGGKIGPAAFLVFKRAGTQWNLVSRVSSQNGKEVFGNNVSISGNTVLTTRNNIFSPTLRQAEAYRVTAP